MEVVVTSLLGILLLSLIVAVVLWGIARIPWLDGDIRAFVRVVVIVVFAIWSIVVIAGLFGVHLPR